MKFLFIINKWANFYYFLHNIAECEWPWPYREKSNLFWKKKLGSFSKKEKEALKNFRKIYLKYFLKIYLGKSFFIDNNPWISLRKKISEKEIIILKEVFSVWQNKFNKIYKENLSNLKKWQKKIDSEIKKQNKSYLTKSIIKTLSIFYNVLILGKKIKVYLMIFRDSVSKDYASGAGGERGRGLEKEKSILIEFSRRPIPKTNYVIGILWHEIIHSFFSPHYLNPLLIKTLRNNRLAILMEEIINRSLFPIGILSIKFLKAPFPLTLSRGSISDINYKQTKEILNLTNQYIQKKKKIDIFYIKEIKRILKWK